MPVIWQEQPEMGWAPLTLDGDRYTLTEGGLALREDSGNGDPAGVHAPLLQRGGGPGPPWVILAAAGCGVRVNGVPLVLGLRVLDHRDEILLPAATPGEPCRFYFSTERLARVEPFPAPNGPATCARCKQPINPGDPAVQCPSCGVWHHQSEKWPCWTYSDRCARCDTPTDLDGDYRWTPEDM